ncbi:MAG: DUF1491 family protein [Pseudomonadota bacterium]
MRLKAEIWVKAYLRLCQVNDIAGFVIKRGDADAGSILIRVNRLDGRSILFVPAPASLDDDRGGHRFAARTGLEGQSDDEVDQMIERTLSFDPDLWVVETEDRQGRHLLDDALKT